MSVTHPDDAVRLVDRTLHLLGRGELPGPDMVGVVICAWRPPGKNRQKTGTRKVATTRNSSGVDLRAVRVQG
jgi:hypothetical protein